MTQETFNQQISLSLRRVEALWQQAHEIINLSVGASQPSVKLAPQHQQEMVESLAQMSHALQELQFAAGEMHQQNEKLANTRVEVEAQLQRYQDLFNFAPDGYLVTNQEGEILEINQAAAKLLNVTQEGAIAKPLTVFIATGERRDFYYKLSKLQRGEAIHHWQIQIQPRGATGFLASLAVSPIQNTYNQVLGLRWRLQDLTGAGYGVSSEKEETHLFCSLLNRAGIGMAILDSEGCLIDSNQTLHSMFGCDIQELQEMFTRLLNLDKSGVEWSMFRQLMTGERQSYQVEKHLFNPEKTREWVRLTVTRVPPQTGEMPLALCILEDISFSKQLKAEQEEIIKKQITIKREQEAIKQLAATPKSGNLAVAKPTLNLADAVEQLGILFDSILSSSSDFFLICDRPGKFIYINQAVAKAWGVAQRDLFGKTWQSLNLSPQTIQWLELQRETVLNIGQSVTDEISLPTLDTVRDYEYTMARLNDLNGEGGAVVITLKDVTEERQAAAAASAALAQEIKLTALQSHLTNLSSVLTQEVRDSLNIIFHDAKLLENNERSANSTNYPQRIQINTQRINHALNDVILLKKIEAQELSFNPVWLDLTELTRALTSEFQETIGGRYQINFISHDYCSGILDEKLLRRTLTNLLLSGIKYSPQGSQLELNLICQDEYVKFQLQNSRISIPETDQKFLLNGFHRNGSSGKVTGQGLGLLVLKHCVNIQGGKIELDNQEGGATRVIVTLPLKQQTLGNKK
ncbi:MAG TPA: hypothetical protein DEG17_16490 [Cyanobacteria bacterium UBA11149]|nr:hypothetical protein [Cyanobacteria bacterium UBA11367]HBE59574.1 hypothetical protein [Cyanobacteria bacterium UBA11366]HBK62603.1 hypothetical protein [Cyanobacteria bacterium UBA11166]HBR73132.1 hypothetical protein [Cyanobacteria bacterium UBA11159]HBS71093.1 hypothetical protein [Cyanobacteria bacterium UBA11153]HBW90422.1 hypothetical protein [Cyanobacteria bacterium UBA11149]HCA95214.1 hypothetical protein [Cyanobacteria bacterium UBA9226]